MRSKIILVLILLFVSFLRLYKLSEVPVSMFGDELDVGYHAYSILETGNDYNGNPWPLHFQSLAEYRTPLFIYAVVPTVALYGITPLGVRLPAALFGIMGVWGIYLLVRELIRYQVTKKEKDHSVITNNTLAIMAAAIMAVNPWHIQYSRAGFEVTMLLVFLLFGLYFFFYSLNKKHSHSGKFLWLSVALLTTTPLIYSTAKLFTLMLIVFLFLLFYKEIFALSRKYIIWAVIAGLIFGGITSYATLFSGGGQRFSYIGIFTDPTIEPEVGTNRLNDARVRGDGGVGLTPTLSDKFFHNKVTFWIDTVLRNYLQSFSTDFLFYKGDPNPRHSIEGMGEFYPIEVVAFAIGLIFFFSSTLDVKTKLLVGFWLIAGAFPASLTRDGGNHATRLILILPPFIVLVAYGLSRLFKASSLLRFPLILGYLLFWALGFIFYQHTFWMHNPRYSERWWHYGWREGITSVKEIDANYDRVFISMKGEPAWIFFAAHYAYPPRDWQENFPVGNDEFVEGFGNMSHIGKFYFGSLQDVNGGIFGLKDYINAKDLYLANASEVGENLIYNPEKKPIGLKLIKAIPFPSGEPAFYLFTKD